MSIELGNPKSVASEQNGPANFHWLVPGLLGGCPRPGATRNIQRDYEALQRVDTRLLVTLTQEWQADKVQLATYGIESFFAPIPDFHPPTLKQADLICERALAFTLAGQAVVFHCHAGKGRTGTLLAAMLIYAGLDSQSAIRQTRSQNPSWIETESQLDFLEAFARHRRSPLGH